MREAGSAMGIAGRAIVTEVADFDCLNRGQETLEILPNSLKKTVNLISDIPY